MAILAKSSLSPSRRLVAAIDEHSELNLEVSQKKQAVPEWEAQRAQLIAELGQARQLLADSDQAAALALERQLTTTVERIRAEFGDEADKLRSQIQQLTTAAREYDAERAHLLAQLDEAKRSMADADQAAALALDCQVATEVARARREFKAEIEKLRQQLQQQHTQASAQWDKERTQLAAERDKAHQALAAAQEQHRRAFVEARKASAETSERDKTAAVQALRNQLTAETEKVRQQLQQRPTQVSAQWDKERTQLAAERDKAHQALAAAQEEHRRELAEAKKAAEADKAAAIEEVHNELKRETNNLRQEMQQQLVQIVTETRKSMVADFEYDARDDVQMMATPGPERPLHDSIRAEVERVEGLIRAISELIDNEATALSIVIRKNAERAELESYLKGIRFSIAEK